jgi:hypothetical protein
MSDDVWCNVEGDFKFVAELPRLLRKDEEIFGEWTCTEFPGPNPAYTSGESEHIGGLRYRIRGHVVNITRPGTYLNVKTEIRDRQQRPKPERVQAFPTLIMPGTVRQEEHEE